MKKLTYNYPWQRIEYGQGFFIPCLDVLAVKEAGLQAALRHRYFGAKAEVGIRKGLLGVWFYRPARTPSV
jgi:hypothetical protein